MASTGLWVAFSLGSPLHRAEISAKEQARGLAEVNTTMNQMDQVTQQNAAMVEETTAASHALAQEATRLAERMSELRSEGGDRQSVRRAA